VKYGLKDEHFQFLDENLIQPLKKRGLKVYIFGSRATGKHHPFSDIDILLAGDFNDQIDASISLIKEQFEESSFPIKVDLVKEPDLARSFRDRIFKERTEV
jgi:predicted nucleotidyltransferase